MVNTQLTATVAEEKLIYVMFCLISTFFLALWLSPGSYSNGRLNKSQFSSADEAHSQNMIYSSWKLIIKIHVWVVNTCFIWKNNNLNPSPHPFSLLLMVLTNRWNCLESVDASESKVECMSEFSCCLIWTKTHQPIRNKSSTFCDTDINWEQYSL